VLVRFDDPFSGYDEKYNTKWWYRISC